MIAYPLLLSLIALPLALLAPASARAAPVGPPAAQVPAARTTLVSPLSLIKTRDLLFGNLASGATAGTVTIDAATGARTATGGVTLLGGTFWPASFTGAASGLNLVIIRRPVTPVALTRIGGGATIQITNFTIQGGQFRLFFTRQAFDFNIGGTLAVGANQLDGTYTGTFDVTIDYY